MSSSASYSVGYNDVRSAPIPSNLEPHAGQQPDINRQFAQSDSISDLQASRKVRAPISRATTEAIRIDIELFRPRESETTYPMRNKSNTDAVIPQSSTMSLKCSPHHSSQCVPSLRLSLSSALGGTQGTVFLR